MPRLPVGKLRSGPPVRGYLRTPGLELRLVNLPGYSPDFNADEAIWGWVREEATDNLCLGTKGSVQQMVGSAPARFPAVGKCTSHLGIV